MAATQGRQRPCSDKPLSVLLAVICYVAGMFTGTVTATWSSSSMMDAAVICGDRPHHVAMKLDDNRKQLDDFRNTTITFALEDNTHNVRQVDGSSMQSADAAMNTTTSSSAFDNNSSLKQDVIDFHGPEYKSVVENMTNTINSENAKIKGDRKLEPSFTEFPTYSEVIHDIIPDFLRPRYATEFLQFPITRFMLRQSRIITGNSERLHAYLNKLQSHQCTIVLFLGGSVTKGHQAGGFKNAYPRFFIDWLNAQYPCVENGVIGSHRAKFTSSSAHSSQEIVVNWPVVDGIELFDLVFLEFNINDAFTPNNPHTLEDKGPVGDTPEYRAAWYFEVLIRRLLLLRKPGPVAIVTFNADYVGTNWADQSVAKWAKHDTVEKARKTLFRKTPEPLKAWISSLYEIPCFSASVWLLPLHSKKGMKRQFMNGNPYSTSAWHWNEACCHPHREGHLVFSLVLAYCIVEEQKMMSYNDEHKTRIEHDFTKDDPPRLRDPIYLSPDEDDLYVARNMDVTGFDFTDPSKEMEWEIVLKIGWSFHADNVDKDKYGFIANDISGKSHFAMSITGGKIGLIEISYLMSYENFGDSIAWISDPDSNVLHHLCNSKQFVGTQQRPDVDRLSGHWEEHASITTVTILKQRIKEGVKKNLHVCLLPQLASIKWKENKFKLIGVRVY